MIYTTGAVGILRGVWHEDLVASSLFCYFPMAYTCWDFEWSVNCNSFVILTLNKVIKIRMHKLMQRLGLSLIEKEKIARTNLRYKLSLLAICIIIDIDIVTVIWSFSHVEPRWTVARSMPLVSCQTMTLKVIPWYRIDNGHGGPHPLAQREADATVHRLEEATQRKYQT
jgi:hypothetical protein